jgi:DNA-binding NarL/FixJ family response regulator
MVITVFGDETNVMAAIEASAWGYILKDELNDSVVNDIETVLQGGSPLSPIVTNMFLRRFRTNQLHQLKQSTRLNGTCGFMTVPESGLALISKF